MAPVTLGMGGQSITCSHCDLPEAELWRLAHLAVCPLQCGRSICEEHAELAVAAGPSEGGME